MKESYDGIITRNDPTIPDSFEVNKSLLDIVSTPLYGSAVKDFYEVFDDECRYYDGILRKKRKKESEVIHLMNSLKLDDPIYQLNSKVLNSLDEYPELSLGRIENVFYFLEDYFEQESYEDYDYYDNYHSYGDYYGDEFSDDEFSDDEFSDDEYVEDDPIEMYDENEPRENSEKEFHENYSNILLDIQNNYEKTISKHSDYSTDLKRHIASGNGLVYSPFINDESVLVGQLQGDIFLVSHFAPSSMKMGYYLLKQALNSKMPMVFAVPEFLAKQLRKCGFIDLGYQIPQLFNGKITIKSVLVNEAVTEDDLSELIEKFSSDFLGLSL